jgi:uncharacterized protein YfeS
MITRDINKKNAHSHAKKILNSKFYWNDTNEAYDAVELFKEEKNIDRTDFPIILIKEYFEKMEWDDFNLYETNFSVIEKFNLEKSGSNEYFPSYESYEDVKDEMRGQAEDLEYNIEEWESLFDANFENDSQNAASIQIDNFIIGVCFFYFYLNGFISKELWERTKIALERELDFDSICKFPHEERDSRLEALKVLKGDLLKMKVYIK